MDSFFKQQTVTLDNVTEKEVIRSIAIGASATHREGCGGFCKLVENIRSDIFLSEAFTQGLSSWWTQSVYIRALRAQNWLGLTLLNYIGLLYL